MPLPVASEDVVRVIQEELPWALQRKENGRWETVKFDIKGRLAAYELLNKTRLEKRGHWRVLPRNEADKYTEGYSAGLAHGHEIVKATEKETLNPRREYIPRKDKK